MYEPPKVPRYLLAEEICRRIRGALHQARRLGHSTARPRRLSLHR